MLEYFKSKVQKNRGNTSNQDAAAAGQNSAAASQNSGSNRARQSSMGALPSGANQQIQTSQSMRGRSNSQQTTAASKAAGGKAAAPADPNVLVSATLESDDVNKYDVTQVYRFELDNHRKHEAYYETSFDVMGSEEHWELDDRLIDYDMLSAQPEDADRIFEELKKRAMAQKKKEKAHAEVDYLLELEDEENEEESETSSEILGSAKILELIKGYTKLEREDFTNNLPTFANKKDKRQIDILLPALKELANDEFSDIKKALLNQFTPLVAMITENFGEMGYQSICGTVFPLLDNLLYDEKEDVRDRAIQVVAEIRTVVKEDWKEHVMRLALNLAHDEQDKLRESAIKLLNEVSGDMGQQINECYIVNEFRAMGLDEQTTVRQTLAQNLTNVSKNISTDIFSMQLFPLYDQLTQDKEWKVRKACADVVAQIAEVTPMDRDAQSLQKLYYRFLLDPSSKIVRGTAFQNIGPFIATLKDSSTIDQRITDFFVNTTMKTNNKDVCYYASFNFPAFIWVTGQSEWAKFRNLYNKLTSVSDIQTQRTLSCSLHEIARILGPELTDSDLLQIADRFLRHNNPDVRLGIMKNLHILLEQVPETKRQAYIQYITQTFNEAGADWRTKEMLAKNLGKFATLFDKSIVYSEFLPMFFKFCEDRVATVSSAAATALAPILIKFADDTEQQKTIIKIVKNNFRTGPKASFKRRQLFIIMCEEVMNSAKEIFDEHFKHDMLSLVADKVSNVRLSLARALKNHFRQIQCTFMHDALVNRAVKVLLNDKSQDVIDLVQDILQFQTDFETSSQSSRNSSQSGDHEAALNSFMEQLKSNRRSAVIQDSDLSTMENEIMQKSGIDISSKANQEESAPAVEPKKLQRQETPALSQVQEESRMSQFVSGVEEDLNAGQIADAEDLEKLAETNFEDSLPKRDGDDNDDDSGEEDAPVSLDSLVPAQAKQEVVEEKTTPEEPKQAEEKKIVVTESDLLAEGEEQKDETTEKEDTEVKTESLFDDEGEAEASDNALKQDDKAKEEDSTNHAQEDETKEEVSEPEKSEPEPVTESTEDAKEEEKSEEPEKAEEKIEDKAGEQADEKVEEAPEAEPAVTEEEQEAPKAEEEPAAEQASSEPEQIAEPEETKPEVAEESKEETKVESQDESKEESKDEESKEGSAESVPQATEDDKVTEQTASTAETETSSEAAASEKDGQEEKKEKVKMTKAERKRLIQEKLAAKKKKEEEAAAAGDDQ